MAFGLVAAWFVHVIENVGMTLNLMPVTGIPLRLMIAEIWGFIAVLIAALFAMIFFPEIVLWLPRMFGYQGG